MSLDATLTPVQVILPAFLIDVLDRMSEAALAAAGSDVEWRIAPGTPDARGAMIAACMTASHMVDSDTVRTAVTARYKLEEET